MEGLVIIALGVIGLIIFLLCREPRPYNGTTLPATLMEDTRTPYEIDRDNHRRWVERYNKRCEAADEQATALIPKIEEVAPKWRQMLEEDALDDQNFYKLDCKRFGDYLTINVQRAQQKYKFDLPSTFISKSIEFERKSFSVKLDDSIQLIPGKPVLDEPQKLFSLRDYYSEDVEVLLAFPTHISERSLFVEDGPSSNQLNSFCYISPYSNQETRISVRVPFPVRSYDDQITFGKSRTLKVPHTIGQQIYEKIMSEIATGYEKIA